MGVVISSDGDLDISVLGLGGAASIIVSPDNKNVYVVSRFDDSLLVFDRNLVDGLGGATYLVIFYDRKTCM